MNWITWPTEPGFYWFYGFLYKSMDVPELQPMRVIRAADGQLIVHYWAAFAYSQETKGLFLKMDVPGTPDLTEVRNE